MNTATEFKCKNCQNSTYELIYDDLPDYFYSLPGKFCYVKCGNCSLFQIFSVPEKLNQFYASYRLHNQENFIYRLFRKIFINHAYYYPQTEPGIILDIGCGNGWYLKEMQQRKWQCFGFEADQQYAQNLARQLGLTMLTDKTLPKYKHKIDLITMNFSLEHLTDPLKMLKKTSELLKNGGQLYLSLPNVESKEAALFREKWFHLDPPRHITFFSKKLISQTLQSLGFSAIIITDLALPTGFAGSCSYMIRKKFIPWLWYLGIIPGWLFSQVYKDGNYSIFATKE